MHRSGKESNRDRMNKTEDRTPAAVDRSTSRFERLSASPAMGGFSQSKGSPGRGAGNRRLTEGFSVNVFQK